MKIYLSLGTNLGDKEQNLLKAYTEIEKRIGEIISRSAFYVTEPWGFSSEHTFLNAACCVETSLTPRRVMEYTQQIERELGRTKKSVQGVYSDRLIDIDLLLCFDENNLSIQINDPDLKIPHPLMQQRAFVMDPLKEILLPEHLLPKQ